MKKVNLIVALSLLTFLFISSCKKDNSLSDFTEMAITTENQAVSSDLIQDAEDQSFNEIEVRGGDPSTGCPTVTYANPIGTFPNTVTIDFGTGCVGKDGRTRSGQIVVTLSDAIANPGAVRVATMVNYVVDNISIEGTKTLTNLGTDANGNMTFSRKISKVKVNFTDGTTANWDADQTITYLAGFGTKTMLDDVISVVGSGSGVNKKGKSFTYNIIEPVIKNKSCKWIVQGVAEVTVDTKVLTIDFGNGDCDRNAQITLPNGKVKDILLRP